MCVCCYIEWVSSSICFQTTPLSSSVDPLHMLAISCSEQRSDLCWWERYGKFTPKHSYVNESFLMYAGFQHKVAVTFCACEPEAVTLVRHSMWPATPKNPTLAFHQDLLLWLESLVLEGCIGVDAFCRALDCKRGKCISSQVSELDKTSLMHKYRTVSSYLQFVFVLYYLPNWSSSETHILQSLQLLRNSGRYFISKVYTLDPFYSYMCDALLRRFNRHQLDSLRFLSSELDTSTKCPACPKVSCTYVCCKIIEVMALIL